jgi:hypothetical protein
MASFVKWKMVRAIEKNEKQVRTKTKNAILLSLALVKHLDELLPCRLK